MEWLTVVQMCTVTVLISWLWKKYLYWRALGVATPGTIPCIIKMAMVFFQLTSPGELVSYAYNQIASKKKRYGGCYFLFRPIFIPIDPELIKIMLVKDFDHFFDRGIYYDLKSNPLSAHLFSIEGAKWKGFRTQITSAFSSGKLKSSFPVLVHYGNLLTLKLDKLSKEGPIEIRKLLARYNCDAIGSTAFGIDINSLDDENADFPEVICKSLSPTIAENFDIIWSFIYPEFCKRYRRIKLVSNDISKAVVEVFNKACQYRNISNKPRNDLMEILIKLKKYDENNNNVEAASFNEKAAQAFVFFFTGIVPTTTVGYFCLYELASNSHIMEKLRKEIADVMEEDGNLTYESIGRMTYLDKVVLETMRKYPVLPNLMRICTKDYKVPGSKLTLKAGTKVIISALGLHYDKDYFENPKVFDPDRFSEEKAKSRHSFAFLPFGKGPRTCLGMRLGFLQTKMSIIYIVHRFDLTINKKTITPLKICGKSNFIISAKGGVWLNCKKLENVL